MKKFIILAAATIFSTTSLYAKSPHIWDNISVASGTWTATMQMISQDGYFVDQAGNKINHLTVKAGQAEKYGLVFPQTNDFNMAYTLTLVKSSANSLAYPEQTRFTDKACVFVVTAVSPGHTDVRQESFNGASCGYQLVHGQGQFYQAG